MKSCCFCFHNTLLPLTKPLPPPLPPPNNNLSLPKLPLLSSSQNTTPPPPPFRDKILFLDSLDLDLPSLLQSHPSILTTTPLSSLQSTVHFLRSSIPLSSPSLSRILSICPLILSLPPPSLAAPLTFLLREAHVPPRVLPYVISRRPRLLLSSVPLRLRPTLRFLRSLRIPNLPRHAHLLSASVDDKLLPRIRFLQNYGFTPAQSYRMCRRFPQIFCYGIEQNLRPKLDYLTETMGRDLGEVVEFPVYFSYSLERRIRRRHEICEERGVRFELRAMLRPGDEEFEQRVGVCFGSSPPVRKSPLWYAKSSSSVECKL